VLLTAVPFLNTSFFVSDKRSKKAILSLAKANPSLANQIFNWSNIRAQMELNTACTVFFLRRFTETFQRVEVMHDGCSCIYRNMPERLLGGRKKGRNEEYAPSLENSNIEAIANGPSALCRAAALIPCCRNCSVTFRSLSPLLKVHKAAARSLPSLTHHAPTQVPLLFPQTRTADLSVGPHQHIRSPPHQPRNRAYARNLTFNMLSASKSAFQTKCIRLPPQMHLHLQQAAMSTSTSTAAESAALNSAS
jgi:hypothetical protein